MRKQLDCVDATEPLQLRVRECHILGATTKGKSRELRQQCMLVLAGMDTANVDDLRVDRNMVRVLFKGKKVWTRYQSTPTSRELVKANDRGTAKALHKLGVLNIPEEGFLVRLAVPRKAVSLDYLHSEEFKARRKKSAEKRKNQPKRSHRAPDPLTLQGIRNGSGFGL